MFSPSLGFLLAPIAIAAMLAIILLLRGWRGRRIDDHPLCRQCEYDLVASAQAANCPECGRDLTRRGAIRIGHRRKRRLTLTFGTLLLLAALGGVGFLGWSHFSNFDWYPYKPLWMLRQDAAGTNATKAIASQREIIARLVAAKLSQSQIDSIVNEALAAQANIQKTWFGWWGDFIELAWQRNQASDQSIIQYARTAVEMSYKFEIADRMRQGSMVSVGASHAPMRAGNTGLLVAEVRYGQVMMEDGTVLRGGTGMSRSGISSGSSGRSSGGSTMNLPVGKHTASGDFTVRIFPSTAFAAGPPGPDESGSNEPQPLAEFVLKFEKPFEVVPSDQEIVERVADATLEPAIRASATVRTLQALRTPRGTAILCDVNIQNPPVDVAFEVILRFGEREWPVGLLSAEAGAKRERDHIDMRRTGAGRLPNLIEGFPADAKTVDVVLRASSEAAESGGIFRIWDGEIVLSNTAVERIVPKSAD